MGCDIHVFMEYRDPHGWDKDRWQCFGGSLHVSRDYGLFSRLAGVRGGDAIIPFRPLPPDLSYEADRGYYRTVVPDIAYQDNNRDATVSSTKAQEWLSRGWSVQHPTKTAKISSPDWHNARSASLDDWHKATHIRGRQKDAMLEAMYGAGKRLEKMGCDVRIVFWFDN